jgi:oligopeptidase B
MPHAPIARADNAADPYRWLENRDSAEVLDYLKAENTYLEQQLSDQLALRETLFQEIKGRIRETDLSLPSPWGPYLYYQRTTAGDEYPRHYRCRKPADGSLTVDETSEQLLLDPNDLADGGFISLGAFSISPDHQRLAYSLDTSGEETYQLFVKELADDSLIELPFEECDGSMTWANDSQTLFFGELDDTHRPHKLYRHRLGTDAAEPVFHEPDARFFLSCYRSSSELPADPATGQQNHQRSLGAGRRNTASCIQLRGPARRGSRIRRRPWRSGWPVALVYPQQPARHQLRAVYCMRRNAEP